jgi:hypothetical protein
MAMSESDRDGLPEGVERDPGLDRLYRAAGSEEPPAHLDAAILAAAHREAGARPRAAGSVLRRWQVPVSIAAVVVLSVSLVTLVKEEGGEQLVPLAPSRLPAPPASDLARTAPAPAEAEQPRPSASLPEHLAVEPRRDAPAAPAAGSGLARDALGDAAGSSSGREGAGAAKQPDGASRPQPQPFRESAPAERRSAATQASPTEDVAAVQTPATAESGAAPVPAAKPAAPRLKASEARKEAAAATDARPPVWQGYDNEPPQKWLDRIAELKRQERVADADAMLAEFRLRFPAHPLPPGLQ